jgi:uncharacterized protein YbjT (DUF2867 family)
MASASNLETLVTIFGGSGFLGRHVVRALCRRDYRIRVAVRRPELAGYLQPLGKVGQVHAVQANLRYPASIEAALRDTHIAVNLVGTLTESGPQTFDAINAAGAGAVARAASAAGLLRMVHVSAIGADPDSPSHYARSKAMGEKEVLAAMPSATILRPSIIFGPEDQFTNRFAALAQMSPAIPLVGGGTKLQPVYVGDVAAAVADAVDGKTRPGAAYELGGPEVLSMREIMQIILAVTERRRPLVSLPFSLAKFLAVFLQFAPGALKLTPDQVALLQIDNVVSDAAKAASLSFEGLGITPDSIEAITPQYLWRFRPTGQFQRKSA